MALYKDGIMPGEPLEFYVVHKPGHEITANQMALWISECLDSVPERADYLWRVWFSEMAYGIFKERFWPWIELEGYKEWIDIPSPNPGDWSVRVKIAGTDGGWDDMNSEEIIDKITIKLEVDDGSEPGMP